MDSDARTSRWSHRVLNAALGALGVAVMALLYALVSQHLGGGGAATPTSGPGRSGAAEGEARVATGADSPSDEIIQVGVRNGCGAEGVAAEARDHLVREGFDVVEVGNYKTFDLDSSRVIDRVGNRAAARRVARAMGIPEERVHQETGETYYLDATVVLGDDYRSLKPFRGKKGDSSLPPAAASH